MGTINEEIAAFISDGQKKENTTAANAQQMLNDLNNANDYENCKWGYTFMNASSIYHGVAFNFSGSVLLLILLPVILPVRYRSSALETL